jgi:hypothetical protein
MPYTAAAYLFATPQLTNVRICRREIYCLCPPDGHVMLGR